MKMEITRVAVLGAGTMGHGIAQVFAQVGKYDVNIRDVEQRFIDNGMSMINDSLSRFVKKGMLDEKESVATLNRIHATLDLEGAVKDADLVIEAVTENPTLKQAVLTDVGRYAMPLLCSGNRGGRDNPHLQRWDIEL